VLYELLAGRNAFEAASVTALSSRILETDPAPLATWRPDVPANLAAVVDRCLCKDPTARYQNVADLALALLPFAPRRSVFSAEQCAATLRGAGWRMKSEHPIASSRTPSLDASPDVDTIPPPPPCGVDASLGPTVGAARFSKEILFAGRHRRIVPLAFAVAAASAALGATGALVFRASEQRTSSACSEPAAAVLRADPGPKAAADAGR
jgi:serine/threonine protein kinase